MRGPHVVCYGELLQAQHLCEIHLYHHYAVLHCKFARSGVLEAPSTLLPQLCSGAAQSSTLEANAGGRAFSPRFDK